MKVEQDDNFGVIFPRLFIAAEYRHLMLFWRNEGLWGREWVVSTIFFSWQSDAPDKTGRRFIERCLERAITKLAADVELEEAVRDLQVDRDTKGVPGSPKIVDTIFSKIDRAEAFIGDVTFVGRRLNGDPIPNPNVLIEYGWALKSLGHDRVLTVMNTVYGKPEAATLPFDMRHVRHPISYHLPDGVSSDEMEEVRANLVGVLVSALRDILKIGKASPSPLPIFQPRSSGASPGRFRAEKLPLAYADDLPSGIGLQAIHLAPGPVSWLRLMPITDPQRTWGFSDLKAAATTSSSYLMPYNHKLAGGNIGIGLLRDADGFGTRVVLRGSNLVHWTSFLFETGEIWGADSYVLAAETGYISIDRPMMVDSIKKYREILKKLGVLGPYKWVAGFEGVRGRAPSLVDGGKSLFHRGVSLVDVIESQGELAADQEPDMAIKSFVRKIFDACGLDAPNL
ncbi:hypothetical protein FBZ87_1038 [Nitrospirillum amazonense]|uniref:Uncharacterized protein n=1 Tax=Nitrospirillum amazonense TaxID=28077 RepID=A0A560K1T0_9PROT|nr:hypothetical protein [Nitrospirillum amazonense]TWB77196.1 hypothetical protein FBZ87_1038 [Nitrospirillum amazonense]